MCLEIRNFWVSGIIMHYLCSDGLGREKQGVEIFVGTYVKLMGAWMHDLRAKAVENSVEGVILDFFR